VQRAIVVRVGVTAVGEFSEERGVLGGYWQGE
jgi:hypothetical protein